MATTSNNHGYDILINQISETYLQFQKRAVLAVNNNLVKAYWKIGRQIVEYEQEGKPKAQYGKKLLENLSHDLALTHGKGLA